MRLCRRLCPAARFSCLLRLRTLENDEFAAKEPPRSSRRAPSCIFRPAGRTLRVSVSRLCRRLCPSARFVCLLRLSTLENEELTRKTSPLHVCSSRRAPICIFRPACRTIEANVSQCLHMQMRVSTHAVSLWGGRDWSEHQHTLSLSLVHSFSLSLSLSCARARACPLSLSLPPGIILFSPSLSSLCLARARALSRCLSLPRAPSLPLCFPPFLSLILSLSLSLGRVVGGVGGCVCNFSGYLRMFVTHTHRCVNICARLAYVQSHLDVCSSRRAPVKAP